MEISKLKDVIYELVNVAEYEFTPEYFKNLDNACVGICDRLDELQAFKDKQEQGLLIELPCKVGDTVWEADEDSAFFLTECYVERFGFDEAGNVYCIYTSKDETYSAKTYLDEFGKTIILTNEEVQKRLAKMHSEAEEALAKMGGSK